jgi:hypothetical protein
VWFLVDRARQRGRGRPLAAVLAIPLTVVPVVALIAEYRSSNDDQLVQLREVFDRTKPTDLVMDGWQGMGVFRPHAFHYYFLHEEIRAMLPPARLDELLNELERGTIRPQLFALDKNLKALGPRFVAFVEKNYATSDGFFYYRK